MDITARFKEACVGQSVALEVGEPRILKRKVDNLFDQAKQLAEDIAEIRKCVDSRRHLADFFFSPDCMNPASDHFDDAADAEIEDALVRCKQFAKSFRQILTEKAKQENQRDQVLLAIADLNDLWLKVNRSPPVVHSSLAQEDDNPQQDYSAEFLDTLKMENELLLKKYTEKQDDIQSLETKVEEIARLQNIFTEKVVQQEENIVQIHHNTTEASENVFSANDLIREAIKHKAGLRIWILFFLIVMTFSLLFLDWYNP